MNVFGFGPFIAVVPFLSSIVFFFLAKEKTFWQRCFASIHGWAALLIVPCSLLMATQYPEQRTSIGFPILLMLGCVSTVSVFYSIATVKGRWTYHLLHVPTVFTIGLSVVASLFILADHH